MRRIDETTFEVDHVDLPEIFNNRPANTHKGHYGRALLIAGSLGMMGAAVLAAKACLRSGVGRLTVHVPACGMEIMQIAVPEATLSIDKHDYRITSLPDDLTRYDAIAIGPGLGLHKSTYKALSSLCKECRSYAKTLAKQNAKDNTTRSQQLIIDADALNIISQHPSMLSALPPDTILTPNPGEYQRLFGKQNAQAVSQQYHLVVVQKAHHTHTANSKGHVFINATGNAGMATAGSGDVLTGMMLGISSLRIPADIAAMLAVYIHGKSGDMAVQNQSQASLLASDIIENIKYSTM